MRSNLTAPYSHLPLDEKQTIHSTISKDDFEYLFTGAFPRSGSQDRIVAQLLQRFKAACVAANIPPYYDSNNEHLGQAILDSIQFNTTTLHPHGTPPLD